MKNLEMKKNDIYGDPESEVMKSLKALTRVDNQIINMTVDTGSPVSFLSWTTAKQISEFSLKTTFVQAENQKLIAQFVDYNKHSIVILGILKADIRSVS